MSRNIIFNNVVRNVLQRNYCMQSEFTNSVFREEFTFKNETFQWFPGHMFKGMKRMEFKLRSVDCIVEVHDARIPLSGRNPDFSQTLTGIKPHLLILNKADLINQKHQWKVTEALKVQDSRIQNVLFTNLKNPKDKGTAKIIPVVKDLILSSDRFNRNEAEDFKIMIIGVPNVGKSTLINVLRSTNLKKKKAARVGAIAGVTRSVSEKIKVMDDPVVYLIDTPGILTPRISDPTTGFKLAICGTLQDHLVGEELIADFLLFLMNKKNNFNYVEFCGLSEPTDDIVQVLLSITMKFELKIKMKSPEGFWVKRPNFNLAALRLLKEFREGGFGRMMLDDYPQDAVT